MLRAKIEEFKLLTFILVEILITLKIPLLIIHYNFLPYFRI